jgi:coproporphyrinogen III oxidase-like Fe-S oxidoreductase
MKYWVGDEYLGFGPCAASDFAGKRFTIEPNLEKYIDGVMHKGVVCPSASRCRCANARAST